jgi:hypothetical protein
MDFTVNFDLKTFGFIMAFYVVLSNILFPAIAYLFFGKTVEAAGNGFIAGSVVSILLWKLYGSKMVKG